MEVFGMSGSDLYVVLYALALRYGIPILLTVLLSAAACYFAAKRAVRSELKSFRAEQEEAGSQPDNSLTESAGTPGTSN